MTLTVREPISPEALGQLQVAFDRAWLDFPRNVFDTLGADKARDTLARAIVDALNDGAADPVTLANDALRRVLEDG